MTDVTLPSGIAKDELDAEVRPQDDLFRHVNGKWIERTEIPADKARYGSFLVLHEEAEQAVREIIEEAQQAEPGTEARKVGDLYASFMDEQRADAARRDADRRASSSTCRSIGSVESFLETLGRLERQGVSGFMQLYVDNDPGDPERYLVFVEQGGIGLPDESYFREERSRACATAYRAHLERMFALAAARRCRPTAPRASSTSRPTLAEGALEQRRHPRQREDVQPDRAGRMPRAAASVDLQVWRDAHGRARRRVRRARAARAVVRRGTRRRCSPRSACRRLEGLAAPGRSSARTRAYLLERVRRGELRLLRPHAHRHPAAARALEARRLARRGRDGRGRRPHLRRAALPARARRRRWTTSSPTSSRRTARSITALDWMGEDDPHAGARASSTKFTPKIGYPVKWRDYSKLEIDADDLRRPTCAPRPSSSSTASSARSASRSTATSGS